ncbi:MAG: hypothetical protein J2P15_19730 [Micromonosporaceae bacterium]|nr:hypothetical protein [Micromonosporaceae bacterium]
MRKLENRLLRASLLGTAAVLVAAAVTAGALAWTSGHQDSGGAGLRAQTGSASQAGTQARSVVRGRGYILEVNADRSVDFTASDLVDPAAATAALNHAGIAGQVAVNRDACPTAPASWDLIDPAYDARLNPRPSPSAKQPPILMTGSETVTLHSSDYPAGGGLLVTIIIRHHDGVLGVNVNLLPYKDVHQVPSTCVARADRGTGGDPN